MIVFIYVTKFGDDPDCIPGNPFFSAGIQSGCGEAIVNDSLFLMSQNGIKYSQALVRSLQAGGYLEGDGDAEQIARLMCQYLQGATSFARVNRCCLDTAKKDVAMALYRLLGLKREHWFAAKSTWPAPPAAS
jgi:TetR/AcrR family transcriptional repressor of nem operon